MCVYECNKQCNPENEKKRCQGVVGKDDDLNEALESLKYPQEAFVSRQFPRAKASACSPWSDDPRLQNKPLPTSSLEEERNEGSVEQRKHKIDPRDFAPLFRRPSNKTAALPLLIFVVVDEVGVNR
jgi:hypothetical protein